jgi:hypothetical protein
MSALIIQGTASVARITKEAGDITSQTNNFAKIVHCFIRQCRSLNPIQLLRRPRQDYVQKRGICKNSARNKVLKWFSKGDTMIPTHANCQQTPSRFSGR